MISLWKTLDVMHTNGLVMGGMIEDVQPCSVRTCV